MKKNGVKYIDEIKRVKILSILRNFENYYDSFHLKAIESVYCVNYEKVKF
jgi:hypothetical protein